MGFLDSDREMVLEKDGVVSDAIDESKAMAFTAAIGETSNSATIAINLLAASLATYAGLALLTKKSADGNFVPVGPFKDHPNLFYAVVTINIFAFCGSYCAFFIRKSKPKLARSCEFCALAFMFFEFVIFLYVALDSLVCLGKSSVRG